MNGIQENLKSESVHDVSQHTGTDQKRCTKCGEVKALSEFQKDRTRKDGHRFYCKVCASKKARELQQANPERGKEIKRKWYQANQERCKENAREQYQANSGRKKEANRKRYQANPERQKEANRKWYQANSEQRDEVARKWREANQERCKENGRKWREANPEKTRAYSLKRYSTPKGKLKCLMSGGMKKSLTRNGKNNVHWEHLVDFTNAELKRHLEKQFTQGMTWQKFLDGEIHLDHIIPISAFNYQSPEDLDFKRCWALKNLQPMWAKANMSKGSKLSKPFQPSLAL